jgi:hypothetical protein
MPLSEKPRSARTWTAIAPSRNGGKMQTMVAAAVVARVRPGRFGTAVLDLNQASRR